MLLGKKPIGTCAYLGGISNLPEPFVWSWSQMIEYNNDYLVEPNQRIYYDKASASFHSFARNSLVQRMKGDWLLMLDTDHVFDPDLACKMTQRMYMHNVDVITGFYQYKFPPYAPVLYRFIKGGHAIIGDWDKDIEFQQVDSAGAGCLLVRRSVFQRITNELKEEPFDIIPPYGEDHSFFYRLRKLKIKAYFDSTIQYNHIVYRPVTLDDYEKEKDNLLMGKVKKKVEGRIMKEE